MDLLRPGGPDGGEDQVVVLSWAQLPQRVCPLLAVGQEAAARVQAARHVHHEAIRLTARVALPGNEGGARRHLGQRQVLRGEGPCVWGVEDNVTCLLLLYIGEFYQMSPVITGRMIHVYETKYASGGL